MYPSITLAAISLLLIASCNGQASNDAPATPLTDVGITSTGHAALEVQDTASQIAEYVVGAFENSKGVLWFGTMGNGVARVANGKLSYIDQQHGLPQDGGHSIAEATDGTMAGSMGKVVQQFSTAGACQYRSRRQHPGEHWWHCVPIHRRCTHRIQGAIAGGVTGHV